MLGVKHLPWIIAGTLVCAGTVLVRWPFLIDSSANGSITAATLAGALFAAAALFCGNQINEVVRRQDAKIHLQDQQRRIRALLDNEFVRVCVNLIQYAGDLIKSLNWPGQTLDFGEPPPNPIFEAARLELLCLPEQEIDALCTFYSGLDVTRREMRDHNQAFNTRRILCNVQHDLETAEKVARIIWPTRKVRFADEHLVNLADKLKEQVAAIIKALA